MSAIPFAVIGSGWRAEFFLKAAKLLPARFRAVGIVTGRPKPERLELMAKWGMPVFASTEDLLRATQPEFVVVSTRGHEIYDRASELASQNMPILAETAAFDQTELLRLNSLVDAGARIEVAEQYFRHPVITSMITLINDGLIGTPTYAHASIMQTYHGISLMRKLLGIEFENATVSASTFALPVVKGPGRYDQPEQYTVISAQQTVATFDFGGKVGVYDFADGQHRSRIRAPRVTVRGECGEMTPERADYLIDERTPMSVELRRMDKGHFVNFEGYHHAGIMAGGRWIYRNPFSGPPLSDDEIAVATCLENMRLFVEQGVSTYGFAETAQDCYLANMMDEAARKQKTMTTVAQPWTTQATGN